MGLGGHLSLCPVLCLPQLQLSLQLEHAARRPGQLLGQCVIGLLHVLQLFSQEGVHLGKARAPDGQNPQVVCGGDGFSLEGHSES